MKGKNLFMGLSYIDRKYIDEAENDTLEARRITFRKPLLVAALVALMLLLVGCAVVYLLSMQEIRLGEQQVTYDVYDYDPDTGEAMAYKGKETQTQQVLTLAGVSNTPASRAAREWYEFRETYDPDRAIQKEVWGDEPEFPAEYYGYGLYTQDMKDKLDEILTKYNLKLRGNRVEFPTTKLLFKALGMENVQNPGSEAQMKVTYADYYDNGNLDLHFDITIPGRNGEADEQTRGYLHYRSKDCFIPDTAVLTEGDWQEWNYTTASGDPVLIIRSQDSGSAWIFCDLEDCTAALQLDIIRNVYSETKNGEVVAVFDLMTEQQLQQVADAIDFSIEPKLIEGWEDMDDGAVNIGQEINGYRIELESAFTDGYAYQIVLRINAPEGVALTDPEDFNLRVDPGNGHVGFCQEDGDGKRNTCHYILQEHIRATQRPGDGSLVYPEGYVVPIYWEDLYLSTFDVEAAQSHEQLLTEGLWKFDVPLNDADYREIEFLSQPITAKASVGWKMDGTDVLEELKVTSIKLRSMGIALTSENKNADFFCFNGQFAYIGMKDGSKVEVSWIELEPVDLDQVAYLQLADGTVLPAPGEEETAARLLAEEVPPVSEEAEMPTFEDGIELLSEPVTVKNLAGWVTDSTGDMEPLYEYFTLTSFVLHPEGAVVKDKRALEEPDTVIQAFLKDGSQVTLTNSGCGRDSANAAYSMFAAQTTLDLTQVDHLLLPDGTVIPMP